MLLKERRLKIAFALFNSLTLNFIHKILISEYRIIYKFSLTGSGLNDKGKGGLTLYKTTLTGTSLKVTS
jgi:hypothetical protein